MAAEPERVAAFRQTQHDQHLPLERLIEPLPPWRLVRDPPRRDWLVEGMFLRGTVAMVSGDGGIGKSLLMQQFLSSAVMGRPWLGRSVENGRAIMLACEDDGDELHRRQWDINADLGYTMDDILEGGLQLVPRVGMDNALLRLDRSAWRMTPTELYRALRARCERDGISYVVIDTATHAFRGNQNDETQVTDFIVAMRQLAIQIQGLVVLTKHPSMSGRALGTGESGNVAWQNSVRARWYLHRDKFGDLVFEGRKSNYGPLGKAVPLVWDRGVYRVVKEAADRVSAAYG